jgi:DNA-binding transcriptional MerR regulator
MLSIGELSRATGLTIKAIRLYDEKGLLPPAHVDPQSGYRFYDATSVERARVIAALRRLDFPLEACAELVQAWEGGADVVSLLEKQRSAAAAQRARWSAVQRALDQLIRAEREAACVQEGIAVELREVTLEPLQVAGIRRLGRYQETGDRLAIVSRAAGRRIRGKALNAFYDGEVKEEDADFESAFPVGEMTSSGEVAVHLLPGGPAASLVHRGPYALLGRSYEKVFSHVRARGLVPLTPSYEVYLRGPGVIFRGDPRKYLTELQIRTAPAA